MKKIKLSQVVNAVLAVTLVLVIIFGYFMLKKTDPKEVLGTRLSSLGDLPPKAEFLYRIYGSADKLLAKPQSVTVYDNRIYVADTGNRRVAVFDYNGKPLFSFGATGTGALQSPHKVRVYNDEIYVTDMRTRLIHKFDLQGRFRGYYAEKQTLRPIDLVIAEDKSVIVDNIGMVLTAFNPEGTRRLNNVGGKGSEKGQFYYPYSIERDREGNYYVADSNNNRIQKFSSDLKLLEVWGQDNDGISVVTPRGIAFDSRGYLYTANAIDNAVKIHDPRNKGKVIGSVTAGETEDEEMRFPNEVFVDSNDRLYVAEPGSNRITVYRINH